MSQKVRVALLEQLSRWIPASVVGIVTDVNAPDSCTVQPIDEGAQYFNVRLRGTIDGSDGGMYAEPKVNSYVIISPLMHDDEQMCVTRCTEVEKWHIKTDSGSKVEVLANGEVHLNGDNEGGVPITADVVSRLNAIEQDINTLKTVFSGWVTVPQDGGAALKAAAGAWFAQQLQQTVNSDIENQKVLHGS